MDLLKVLPTRVTGGIAREKAKNKQGDKKADYNINGNFES
jgi:hypothetical protein